MKKENGMCNVFTGLLIGAAAGAAAGILLAPHSGKETRDKLRNEADRMRKELEKYSNDFSERACKIKEGIEERLSDLKNKLQSSADDFKSEALSAGKGMK